MQYQSKRLIQSRAGIHRAEPQSTTSQRTEHFTSDVAGDKLHSHIPPSLGAACQEESRAQDIPCFHCARATEKKGLYGWPHKWGSKKALHFRNANQVKSEKHIYGKSSDV